MTRENYHRLLASKYVLLLGGLACWLTSCVTPRQLSYFQPDGLNENSVSIDSLYRTATNAAVTKGLILTIRVNSTSPTSETATKLFEPIIIPGRPTDPPTTTGYLVDEEGNLALPLIGVVQAAGKTTNELADTIRVRLRAYLQNPTVSVQYTTRISVLGEVNKPSVFVLGNPVISLPEALGLAGDLTTYARRDNVLVIRTISRRLVYNRIDLTKLSVIKSPYYILQGGDVVYVSPSKARAASVDRTYQIIPIILSTLTVLATVISLALR